MPVLRYLRYGEIMAIVHALDYDRNGDICRNAHNRML